MPVHRESAQSGRSTGASQTLAAASCEGWEAQEKAAECASGARRTSNRWQVHGSRSRLVVHQAFLNLPSPPAESTEMHCVHLLVYRGREVSLVP